MTLTLTLTLDEVRVLKRILRDSAPKTPAAQAAVLTIHDKLMKEAQRK